MTQKAEVERALECVVEANTAQMNDPAFVKELTDWIRFGKSEAVHAGDGLYSGASGNPSAPRWLGKLSFNQVFTATRETKKYARQLRSSAGVAVFVSDKSDIAHWIEAGRCYERFALQATALGIRNAMINQPVEVVAVRQQFASFFRYGRAAARSGCAIRMGAFAAPVAASSGKGGACLNGMAAEYRFANAHGGRQAGSWPDLVPTGKATCNGDQDEMTKCYWASMLPLRCLLRVRALKKVLSARLVWMVCYVLNSNLRNPEN